MFKYGLKIIHWIKIHDIGGRLSLLNLMCVSGWLQFIEALLLVSVSGTLLLEYRWILRETVET